ncbi:MAG: hypothetical protein P1V51_19010 [Deltaproteobacteria bacterium]|nr:hypothetical protein [Deltaproteobacteria bacterium]
MSVASLVGVLLVAACTSGRPEVDGTVEGELSGSVHIGAVSGAQVSLLAEREGDWIVLDRTVTDAEGRFTLATGSAAGLLRLEATGGDYIEEASGVEASLADHRLEVMISDFEAGEHQDGLVITPISTLVAAFARWRQAEHGESPQLALREAARHIEEHFGQLAWTRILPAYPTGVDAQVVTEELRAGLLLAGLSRLALNLTERHGYTPADLTAAELTALLAEDIEADGKFDGKGHAGQLMALEEPLNGYTLRHRLAVSTVHFLQSERNRTRIGRADVDAMVTFINGNDNPELFRREDPPLPLDLDDPVIEFDEPAEGTGVRGEIVIRARAIDRDSGIAALGFFEPLELVSFAPVGLTGEEATIEATLDVSPLPEGELFMRLRATDGVGLQTVATRRLVVSNHSPGLSVATPLRDADVLGATEILASATPNPGTGSPVVRLELLAPAGLVDLDATAAGLRVQWDTTRELEGPFLLVLEAEDALGSIVTVTHPVVVDNREPPVVGGVALIAGRPVRGAIAEAHVITETGSWPIGSSTTDGLGHFSITLEDENVTSPVALVVRGAPGAAYHHLIAQHDVPFPDPDALSAFAPEVSAAGDLLVSPWTTLADTLARSYHLRSGMEPPAAYALAEEMISGHFKSSAWPELASNRPPDLTVDNDETVDSARLSLADAGLLHFTYTVSEDVAGDPLAHSFTGLVSLLSDDLNDQVFDGWQDAKRLLVFGDYPADEELTRAYLATGIHGFVLSPVNGSGLQADAVLSTLLNEIATDSRAIYPTPGTAYDSVGPVIHWVTPSEGADAGENEIIARAWAEDPAGGVELILMSTLGPDEDPAPEIAQHRVPNTFATGEVGVVRLEARASDRFGNESTSTLSFTRPRAGVTVRALDPLSGADLGGFVSGPFDLDATATGGFATDLLEFRTQGWPAGLFGTVIGGGRNIQSLIDVSVLSLDGPISLEVAHRTVDGDLATATLDVVVDRSLPSVSSVPLNGNLLDGRTWYGPASPGDSFATVPVRYVVGDPTSEVTTLELFGSGVTDDGTSIPVPPVARSTSCTTSCMGELSVFLVEGVYELYVRAVDQAGNETIDGPHQVWVDTTAPTLQDLSGTFDDEGMLDFVWQGGAGAYVPRAGHVPNDVSLATLAMQQWKKMEQRLHGTTELDAQLENLPTFHVAAADPGQSIFTPTSALRVESEYSFQDTDGTWKQPAGRGWKPLISVTDPAAAPATHTELASLERLGPNLMYDVRRHQVSIRAIDASGNASATVVYDFELELLPAPVAVEVDADYSTTSTADPQSLYHYTFGARTIHQLFAESHQATFTLGGPRIARAVIHQPWGFPVKVWLDTGSLSDLKIEKSSGTQLIAGPLNQHDCGTPTAMPDCATAVPAGEPNTPCLTAWNDPARENVYRRNADGDPNGALSECFCDASPCSGVQVLARSVGSFISVPREKTPMAHILDSTGLPVSPSQPGVFELPQGEYVLFLVFAMPTDLPFLRATVTPTFPGRYAYGTVLESRESYLPGSDQTITVGTPVYKFGQCITPSTCTSYATQEEKLLEGDFSAAVAPADLSSHLLLNLRTLSTRLTSLPARDPDLGTDPTISPFFALDATHSTDESEL